MLQHIPIDNNVIDCFIDNALVNSEPYYNVFLLLSISYLNWISCNVRKQAVLMDKLCAMESHENSKNNFGFRFILRTVESKYFF